MKIPSLVRGLGGATVMTVAAASTVLLLPPTSALAATGADAASLALANAHPAGGGSYGPCNGNSLNDGNSYKTTNDSGTHDSCTQDWCADFVMWVWAHEGFPINGLNALASSFKSWAGSRYHGDSSYVPQPGDAVEFKDSGGTIRHVGIVVGVRSGQVDVVSGNWGNKVVENGWINSAPGSYSSAMGYTLDGYATPLGVTAGASVFQAVMESNVNGLVHQSQAGPAQDGQGLEAGSGPSVARLTDGTYATAFEANDGSLRIFGPNVHTVTDQGVKDGTVPSIAAGPNNSYRVAFQGKDSNLYYYDSASGTAGTGQGLDPASSPSIAALPAGGYEIVFQANNHELRGVGDSQGFVTNLFMHPGTSPSAAASGTGSSRVVKVAFQGTNNDLYTFVQGTGGGDVGQGMQAATSPAITVVPGGFDTAFQANDHSLRVVGDANPRVTSVVMRDKTSPAIVSTGGGNYLLAAQASSSNLVVWNSVNSVTTDTGQGMNTTTSPSIA